MPDVRPPGFADPPAGHGLARYRGQQLVWRACGALRCATILVPLDYARPDEAAISLTVARRVVTHGTAHGIVVTNPGGPGGPGVEFLSGLRGDPFGDVDVVSWDPRGSGGSTPVRCWDQAAQDAYAELDGSPDDAGERSALVNASQRFGLSCLAGSGPLLAHVSTLESARDLDLIRDALGLDRVDYVGFSNGTLLGADYAQLFPGRVGRFVLDGAVNISGSPVVQLEGFDRALLAMLDWCIAQRGGCELGTSQQDAVSTLTAFWARLDAAPLPVGNRMLTQTLAADGVVAALYSGVSGYPELRSALIGAIRHGRRPRACWSWPIGCSVSRTGRGPSSRSPIRPVSVPTSPTPAWRRPGGRRRPMLGVPRSSGRSSGSTSSARSGRSTRRADRGS